MVDHKNDCYFYFLNYSARNAVDGGNDNYGNDY